MSFQNVESNHVLLIKLLDGSLSSNEIIKECRKMTMDVFVFKKLIIVLDNWTINENDILASLREMGKLIVYTSKSYKKEFKKEILSIGLLKFMTLYSTFEYSKVNFNAILGACYLLVECVDLELSDYQNSFTNVLKVVYKVPKTHFNSTLSRLVFNLVKLGSKYKSRHKFKQFSHCLNQFDVSVFTGIDTCILITKLCKAYKNIPNILTTALIYLIEQQQNFEEPLQILYHRHYSKKYAKEMSTLFISSKVPFYFKILDEKRHFQELKLFIIYLANLSHSQLGCSFVFQIVPDLLFKANYLLHKIAIDHGDLILGLTSLYKRMIAYARHRITSDQYQIILAHLYDILEWSIVNIAANPIENKMADRFLKFVSLNVLQVFKTLRNTNIYIAYSKVFDLLHLTQSKLTDTTLKSSRLQYTSKLIFKIINIHCLDAFQLVNFAKVPGNMSSLYSFLSMFNSSNLNFLKRFVLLMNSAKLPALIETSFLDAIPLTNPPQHDCLSFLIQHVFSSITITTTLEIIALHSTDSRILLSMYLMLINTHKHLIALNQNLIFKELKQTTQHPNYLDKLLYLLFNDYKFPQIDPLIDSITLVIPSHNSFFFSSTDAIEYLIHLQSCSIHDLVDVLLYCDAYMLDKQATIVIAFIFKKITPNSFESILTLLYNYNSHNISLLTSYTTFYSHLVVYWLLNRHIIELPIDRLITDASIAITALINQ